MAEFPRSDKHGQDSITSVLRLEPGVYFEGGTAESNPVNLDIKNERVIGFPRQIYGSGPGVENPMDAQGNPNDPTIMKEGPGFGANGDGTKFNKGGYDGGRVDRIVYSRGGGGGNGNNNAGELALERQQLNDQYSLAQQELAKPQTSSGGGTFLFVAILVVGGVFVWWYFKHHHKGEAGNHSLM